MKKKASVKWQGGLEHGRGKVSTESNALSEAPYSFNARYSDCSGTSPEELVGAAHAGCFVIVLASELAAVGLTAECIDAKAVVHLEREASGVSITRSDITVSVSIHGASNQAFLNAVQAAKSACPVSRALKADVNINVVVERV